MTTQDSSATKPFGLSSGIGLVVANMVGAGVFLSTGFMAQSLSPGVILLCWLIGCVLALCGARAYAEVARLVPRSGGEYRFLTELLHPAPGYLAGWASLLLGFSAPIALDALAAGAFARAVFPALPVKAVGAGLIVALVGVHAFGTSVSTRVQNGLVAVKVMLLLAFVGIGLAAGQLTWPTWVPPSPAESLAPAIAGSLFFIAFAFSGWNAAVYAADEFRDPARTVPRAMLLGCLLVGALYLVVNALFVMNLTPAQGTVVFRYQDFTTTAGALSAEALDTEWAQVTLGQAVMAHLLGPGAAKVMSAVMLLLFASATSAMMLVGPRVYAAMARDGYLPRALVPAPGKPPSLAVALQGALALIILFTHELRAVLSNVGAILTLFSALTALGLFRAVMKGQLVSRFALLCAGVYVLSSGWMLYFGFKDSPSLMLWVSAVAAVAVGAWAVTRTFSRRTT